MHALAQAYKAVNVLRPAALTATGQSSSIDLGAEYKDDVAVIMNVGAVSGTSPTLDMVIQKSTDNSTWVTGATFTQVTAANKLGCGQVNMDGGYRYLRASYTIGGTSPSFTLSVEVMARHENASSTLNSLTPA